MKYVYIVKYPPTTPPDDGREWPVLDGCGFRFRENAVEHAAKNPGSKVKRVRLDTSGFTLRSFRDEPHPPAYAASGGKLLRRYRRNADATRDLAPARRHGARGRSPNFMRPPGCGSVNYQDPAGKNEPRIYTGAIDAVTEALAGLE